MKKLYALIFSVILSSLFALRGHAQNLASQAIVPPQPLTDMAATLNTRYQANHQRALDLAKQHNWALVMRGPNGSVAVLDGVTDLGAPVYLSTDNNIISAATTQTNLVQPGGSLGLNLSGSSSNMAGKIAIWDGSTVLASHQEFTGKTITNRDASTLALEDHSTHVAGTMIARGAYAPAKGMAFGATTLQSFDYNNDLSEISAAASGLLVSNHSYGYTFGWYYDGTKWIWYGVPGNTEDYYFGAYLSTSITLDQIALAAPKYLIVFCADNARGYNGPAVGSTYYGYNSATDFTIVNKGARPANISSQTGYDNLDTHGVAKNVLTVGAVNPLPNGPSQSSDITSAYFSSWGPTDDGRVKPDICGMGVAVTSSAASANNAYITLDGTSMAAPNVTGSIYLLQEYYSQKNAGNFMRAATLKGLVCHTAYDAGNVGPDYTFGWGLLDMGKAAQAITNNGNTSLISEKNLPQGTTQTINVIASGSGPLVGTICWADPAGTAQTVGNDRTPRLVNDLDIRISDGTTTFKPWVLDPNNPSVAASTGDNIRDNVEQVYIASPVVGKTYTITVSHKGTTLTNTSQDYSLIVTGVGGQVYCASAPLSSADSRINNVTLNDLNNTPAAGCTTYSNYTSLSASLEQGKTYPLSIAVGTCGANFSKIAKVWIDWNNNGTFEASELVATSPVYATAGTFNTTITVPSTVVPGNKSVMRIVLSETTDPTTITACGSYAKGETQDYSVKFLLATNDVGIAAINSPAINGVCQSATSPVSVNIKNYGSASQTNIPVTVTITAVATNTVTTLNEVYTGTIASLGNADFALTGTFNAVAGASYTVTATTTLSTDQNPANNSASSTSIINTVPLVTAGTAQANFCTDLNLYNLSATANGTVFWYKNIGDALPFTSGANVNTAVPPTGGYYYAGVNDFSGTIGPATKNVFSAGGYNQFGPGMVVSTRVPILIQSARLYIGNSGAITFSVANASGVTVSSTTINAIATATTPTAGAMNDDPNDQGKVYNLNLVLPTAGTYTINTTYADVATIYRNNGGVTGYPMTLGGIFNIVGSNAVSATAPTDTTYGKNFYYYFYNMKVKSLDCIGGARIAVPYAKPTITLTGGNLTSNYSANNQWYLNGNLIVGATSQVYKPLVSGIYRVDVTNVSGCVSKSDDFSYVVPATGTGDGADISLAVFPIPTVDQLHIAFVAANAEALGITVTSAVGQNVYNSTQQVAAGNFNTIISLGNLPDGVYFLKLKIGDKSYVRKISVMK